MPYKLVETLAHHIQWEPSGSPMDAHKQCNLKFKAISWQMSCTLHKKKHEDKKRRPINVTKQFRWLFLAPSGIEGAGMGLFSGITF